MNLVALLADGGDFEDQRNLILRESGGKLLVLDEFHNCISHSHDHCQQSQD